MKTIKIIFALFIAVTITSCGDSEKTVALDFSLTNVSGTYKVKSFNQDLSNTVVTQGTSVDVSNSTKIGDSFEVDLILNAGGTFTVKGPYRVVTTVTPVDGSATVSTKILNIDNSGSFSINKTGARTITFNSSNGDFLNGEYNVNLFNENALTLSQDSEETDGNINIDIKTTILFEKK
ncbi:hypothetical protein H9I45_11965 [Polaribacter haliotis]|uniref:Lipocalin-like domain-containing protein n=1 Tax=Polaribacter haliotis TaxID=1888915 RepID=A0A7L8ADQ7_9FLAO|nr:hypothetical protein [Polaribacter haliotis]QOD60054.1 hypothetical protein H9I45_11965 [Polaribacter haliotis]